MLGDNPFGPHGDILSAKPEDEAGKAALAEEIKSRARGAFAAKDFRAAEMLYTKGVEVTPEDAALHSNRAAARLGLNKIGEALVDAEESVRLDPSYPKGHYRKGQALLALGRPTEAVEAFEAGAKLEPDKGKVWQAQIAKARIAEGKAQGSPASTAAKTVAPSSSSSSAARSSPAPSVDKAAAVAAAAAVSAGGGDDEGAQTAGRMRGYKKTTDGRTTTYFHNELSEEDKRLIGDIAPKKIGEGGGPGGNNGAPVGSNGMSVWNNAGTWEEKDMSAWAKKRLEEMLSAVRADTPEAVIEVAGVDGLEGDAQITFSRGKKRYLFDFRLTLKWEAELEEGTAKGELVFPDVGGDCGGEYDVECKVDSTTPPKAKCFVDRYVRAEGGALRTAAVAAIASFVEEFHRK